MKKILLINPPFNIKKENYDSSVSVGLLTLASYLRNKGCKVKMIDFVRQKKAKEIFNLYIDEFDYLGLSVMTTQISDALKISKLAKKKNPNCKIIWGGGHPTFFTRETVGHEMIDIVSFEEGEDSLVEILEGKPLSEVKGIAYINKDGEIVINEKRELIDPVKSPPFNWDLVPAEIKKNLFLVPSITSRGCPHQCTFCINAILHYKWRPRTAEQVLGDLKVIKENKFFQNKRLRFWDENFFVDINRAKKIIDGIIERKLEIPWETTVRCNYFREGMIDDELAKKLKKSGCYLLSFGAESGSPRILEKIKKGITPDETLNSARVCLRHGIIPQYSFMIGLPGETKEDMMMTIKLIDRLTKLSDKVQILGPQAFRPYPGSLLYQECLEAGWEAPKSLEEWAHLVENELSYLTVQNFPWVRDKDFVESMEAYVRFGAHSMKSAMGSSISAKTYLKLPFVLVCKLRWKLKFFKWPIEFKLAKRFVTK